MNKWIAEFELEDGDSMPEHMDLNFKGARLDFHCKSVSDCIPIPDNATNGEVIKAVFPDIESRLDEKTEVMLVKWANGIMQCIKASWWNAKYKAESEEEDV